MPIAALHVQGYRSIRDLRLEPGRVNVVVGANGVGKTNLYRALRLLSEAASGRLAAEFLLEGGFPSALWAGPRKRKGPVELSVSVDFGDFDYQLVCGLMPQAPDAHKYTSFIKDPQVKLERVSVPAGKRRSVMMERKVASAWVRDERGAVQDYPLSLSPSESILSQVREPHRYPELAAVRQRIDSWRFYHRFPTGPLAAMRRVGPGARTPVLAQDGADLAPALLTILELGDREGLELAIARALGAALLVDADVDRARFEVTLMVGGLNRAMGAAELSDGTLQFLSLLAALLSIEPPELLVLNEPESNLHVNLLDPLAELIVRAAERCQIWITTHSPELADAIGRRSDDRVLELYLDEGETRIKGMHPLFGTWQDED